MALTEQQRKSVECIDGPLLISAGAGSGKTFTLTQRIVHALISPGSGIESIDEVLAITFTDKAAAEIRSRVRATLRAEELKEQALKADGAWISTIHGMCSRILHAHAFELGLDPAFTLLDGVQEEKLRTEALEAVLMRETSPDQGRFAALFAEYKPDNVVSMAKCLIGGAASMPQGLDGFVNAGADASYAQLTAQLADAYETVASCGTEAQVEIAHNSLATLSAFEEVADFGDEAFGVLLGELGRPDARGKAKEAAAAAKDLLAKAYVELNLRKASPLCDDLLFLAREVEAEYEQRKLALNKVDTDGLLKLTLKAFNEHPAIADRYRNQFKLVMVDEFQDTNQLQIDIIDHLAAKGSANLCTVGDSQQSIYKFRGADVGVYRKHKAHMRSPEVGALSVELADNFRSHGDVLAFVRKVCGVPKFFCEPFLDLQAGRDEGQVVRAGRHYRSNTPRIDVMLAEGESAAEARIAAARAMAERFAELRDAGHKAGDMVVLLGAMTYASVYADALRAQGFDCMVTAGSAFYSAREVKLIGHLLRVLATPADTESLFILLASDLLPLSSDDLIDLTTSEDAATGDFQRLNLADAIIRFGKKDKAGKAPVAELSPRAEFAIEVLNDAWTAVGRKQPSEVVRRILASSGWLSRLQDEGVSGQAIAGNLFKALRVIEGLERESGFDMMQVAAKFAQLANEKEKPGALMVADDDAVRIMTVHGSKGLEFPLVAVAECFTVKENDAALLVAPSSEGMLMSLKPDKSKVESKQKWSHDPDGLLADGESTEDTVRYSELTHAEARSRMLARRKREALEEKRRLLYVALTRAREALMVVMFKAKNSKQPIQADIETALFGAEGFPTEDALVPYGGSEPLRYRHLSAVASGEGPEADEATSAEQAPATGALAAAATPATDGLAAATAPATGTRMLDTPIIEWHEAAPAMPARKESALFSYSSLSEGDVAATPSDEYAGARIADADKATDLGSAFHRLGQMAALASIDAAYTRFDAIAATYHIKDIARLRAAFERWASSALCARALGCDRHIPEVPFCIPIGDAVLEGEIDLLCFDEGDASCLIIDYKTGGSSAESPEQLYEKHLLQAQCYAFAVLHSGFSEVELAFARVEQDDPLGADALGSQRYRFTHADLEGLRAIIAERKRKKAR